MSATDADRPSTRHRVATGVLAFVALGTVAIGQWLALARLGAGEATDAWMAGQVVPVVISAVVVSSILHTLIPVFARRHVPAETWGLLWVSGGFTCLLSAALALTARWWVPALIPGMAGASGDLLLLACQIQALSVAPTGFIAVGTAALQGRGRFAAADGAAAVAGLGFMLAVGPALAAGGVVGLMLLWPSRAVVHAIAIGALQGPPVRPAIAKRRLRLVAARIRALARARFIVKVDPMVDAWLVSWAPAGSLTLLSIGHRGVNLVVLLVNRMISRPALREAVVSRRPHGPARALRRALGLAMPVVLAGYGVHLVLGRQILALLAFGNLSPESVLSLWRLLSILGLALIAGTAAEMYQMMLIGQGDAHPAARIARRGFLLAILAKAALLPLLGVYGLAWGAVLYKAHNLLFYARLLNQRSRPNGLMAPSPS